MLPTSDSSASLRVLIVDDDPALARTTRDVLRIKGFEPSIAQSGSRALELTSITSAAIALVDLRLPDMDGLDLITRLHEADALTEVVVLTGNASVSSAARAVREQIFDYLLKPVSPDQLVNTIERAGERWYRRRAEVALATTEQRFRSLIENAADPIAIFDQAGVIRYASPAYQHILGYAADSLIGTNVFALVHPDDMLLVHEVVARLLTPTINAASLTIRVRRSDGTWRTLSGMTRNLLEDPAIGGIVFNSRDVTDQLALEAQLRHAQKIDAIGQFAGGIAHDLNNILTAIGAFGDFAAAALPPDHEARADLDEVQLATKRGAALTRQLLAFSRRQVLQPRPIDLSEVARGMEPMLRRLLSVNITCTTSYAADGAQVMADPSQIEQVLLNLVLNARDAMERGGTVAVETSLTQLGADHVRAHPGTNEGPHMMLSVSDTGQGMDAETQARIFEPFFTTKPVGCGTGLGLSTVYGIVRQSGGSISLSSTPGRGTTFKVYLPCIEHAASSGAVWTGATPAAMRALRILLAEDDNAIRSVATRILEQAGHSVLTAQNGREGIELLDAHGSELDLVIADLVMPEVDGWELAEHVTTQWPKMPLLLMSGFTAQVVEHGARSVGEAFLQKPFTSPMLLEKIRVVMQAAEPALS